MNWKNKKRRSDVNHKGNSVILATGANGFIGRHLVSRIAKLGYRAVFIDTVAPEDYPRNSRLDFIRCDITKRNDVKRLGNINGRLNLIHLAACVPHTPLEEKKMRNNMRRVNIKGTINLLEGIKDKLDKVCYISTLEVYGVPMHLPITERHPVNPVSLYGQSKSCAEYYVSQFCLKNRIPCIILRFSSVYGPGENYDRAIPNFIRSAIAGKPIFIYGNGSDIRDYLYIDDAIKALLASVKKRSAGGLFNIASGKAYQIKDIAKAVIKLCNSKSKIKFCRRKKKHYNVIFDISNAKKKLNFSPRTEIEGGLRKEIEWFRRQ